MTLVSAVIPCYNQAALLGEAIESVLSQSHRPIETIVVDDGSIDDTAEMARSCDGVRCIRQENRGVPRGVSERPREPSSGPTVVGQL
jgi:glycosyltransferase involved in cell wall biosynthesis